MTQWEQTLKQTELTITELEKDFERMARKLNELRSLRDTIKWRLGTACQVRSLPGLGRRKVNF